MEAALHEAKDPHIRAELQEAIENAREDERTVRAYQEVFGASPNSPPSVRRLEQNLRTTEHQAYRVLAIQMLDRDGSAEATAVLVRWVREQAVAQPDPDPTSTLNAVAALARLASPDALSALRDYFSRAAPDLRIAAIQAIGPSVGQAHVGLLQELATRAEPQALREHAATLLSSVQRAKGTPDGR